MICAIVEDDDFYLGDWAKLDILPENSLAISRSPFCGYGSWDNFFIACKRMQENLPCMPYVLIDACWDPVFANDSEITYVLQELSNIFPSSKILLLSSLAQHYFDHPAGVVYFPLFATLSFEEVIQPRQGRMGCLNRRHALHRVHLMHELLTQGLLDADRDIYSVSLVNVNLSDRINLGGTGFEWIENTLQSWPDRIATHPDGFPSDYTIMHPAWHTGIAIVTETEPGNLCLVTEKTAKALASRSCFTIYMADAGHRVLEELGFAPRFFAGHAEHNNIDPILQICRDIDTEAAALDYRQQHIGQIEHNYQWYGNNIESIKQRPWYAKFAPKLQYALNNL
jgi:hypothetical protein